MRWNILQGMFIDVLHVPRIAENLFFVSKTTSQGHIFSSKIVSAWSKTCTKKSLDKAHTKTNFTSYSAEQN
jgi:hypothetical protein